MSNVQFTIFYFIVHRVYFSCISCLQDFEYKFNNTEDVNTVFENSAFDITVSWSDGFACDQALVEKRRLKMQE